MNKPTHWDPQDVQLAIDELKDKPGALLPILHKIQDQLGYIPKESVPMIAKALQQTSAEIHGVISFYHHFRTTPSGNHVIQVCRAEACQARGSRQLESHIKNSLNIDYHGTTRDQEFTLEPVYCLGNCTNGPNIQINDKLEAEVTADKFDALKSQQTTYLVELT
ncbi:formate dehydrogenase subunit gamma [Paraglaciecola sp.]|uniref:formate dehydrogenase subunit gamma n=1 Tax=Paraglaciecola sp. TaxID=1920173 RepID=UPI003EF1B155